MRIKNATAPKMEIKSKEVAAPANRPDFSYDEWQQLLGELENRTLDAKQSEETIWFRKTLLYFCRFLYGTGLRVSEAKNLNFGHLELVDSDKSFDVSKLDLLSQDIKQKVVEELFTSGQMVQEEIRIRIPANLKGLKTPKHARTVIPLENTKYLIDELTLFYKEENIEIGLSSPLWMHKDGSRVERFDHQFDRVLKKCGLLRKNGEKRSLTSLRHTYATQRIYDGATSDGLWWLCSNMGTSEKMINDHYNNALVETRKDIARQNKAHEKRLKVLLDE